MFWHCVFFNSNDENLKLFKNDYEKASKHPCAERSSENRATARTTSIAMLPTFASRTPLPPKEGSRVSAQIQVEPSKKWKCAPPPKEEIVPMSQDHKDPLLQLTHGLVETCKKRMTFGALGKLVSLISIGRRGEKVRKRMGQNIFSMC